MNAQSKIQIKGKGRAIQGGLNFFHEALNETLAAIEEINRGNLLFTSLKPHQALIGPLIGTAHFRNFRSRHGKFANREQMASQIVDCRKS